MLKKPLGLALKAQKTHKPPPKPLYQFGKPKKEDKISLQPPTKPPTTDLRGSFGRTLIRAIVFYLHIIVLVIVSTLIAAIVASACWGFDYILELVIRFSEENWTILTPFLFAGMLFTAIFYNNCAKNAAKGFDLLFNNIFYIEQIYAESMGTSEPQNDAELTLKPSAPILSQTSTSIGEESRPVPLQQQPQQQHQQQLYTSNNTPKLYIAPMQSSNDNNTNNNNNNPDTMPLMCSSVRHSPHITVPGISPGHIMTPSRSRDIGSAHGRFIIEEIYHKPGDNNNNNNDEDNDTDNDNDHNYDYDINDNNDNNNINDNNDNNNINDTIIPLHVDTTTTTTNIHQRSYLDDTDQSSNNNNNNNNNNNTNDNENLSSDTPSSLQPQPSPSPSTNSTNYKILHGYHRRSPLYIPLRTGPLLVFFTWFSHIFGASIGREGVAVALGGCIGHIVYRNSLRYLELYQYEALCIYIGMSSGFSALFGTPLTSAFFIMELTHVNILQYQILIPIFIASYSAHYIFEMIGTLPTPERSLLFETLPDGIPSHSHLNIGLLSKLVVFGLIMAGYTTLFTYINHFTVTFIRWFPLWFASKIRKKQTKIDQEYSNVANSSINNNSSNNDRVNDKYLSINDNSTSVIISTTTVTSEDVVDNDNNTNTTTSAANLLPSPLAITNNMDDDDSIRLLDPLLFNTATTTNDRDLVGQGQYIPPSSVSINNISLQPENKTVSSPAHILATIPTSSSSSSSSHSLSQPTQTTTPSSHGFIYRTIIQCHHSITHSSFWEPLSWFTPEKIGLYILFFLLCIPLFCILYFCHNNRYSSLGFPIIHGAILRDDPRFTIYPYDFILKSIATILSVNVGFKGGEITPIFSIGASLGGYCGELLGLDPSFSSALGYIAFFSGTTQTLLGPIMLSVEIFGPHLMLYCTIVCVVCFGLSGPRSIYSAQKRSYFKW